jgi:glycogen debranching enzyme
MEEIIQVEDQHYILATSPRADERSRVLKHGDTFAVFDRYGDIRPVGLGEEGLFHDGTRFLNRLTLRLNGRHPLLLSSTIREDNALLTVDLTNADISANDRLVLPRDTLHLMRSTMLYEGTLYTCLRLRSFSVQPVDVQLELTFDADFVDVFEIRGSKRQSRGKLLPPKRFKDGIELSYRGLDGVVRVARLQFSPEPSELSESRARLPVSIPPYGQQEYSLTVQCRTIPPDGSQGQHEEIGTDCVAFRRVLKTHAKELEAMQFLEARLTGSSGRFNKWLQRSAADLRMMMTRTERGYFPYAGVPWFSTPFGRDAAIVALEWLWVNPDAAAGVLRFLAANQAKEGDPERDAEPGKIFHEMRGGEMAALGEVPFARYYGTVDATPLFVVLAGAYYKRTADRTLIGSIWPNIEAALNWIERYGDIDGDGFVEYARRSTNGLTMQGWKDSPNSVFHADGTLAEAPIALCEVQGYVYEAWQAAGELAVAVGKQELHGPFEKRAAVLRKKFEQAFWLDDLSTYAMALDAHKKPCRIRTSNAGHCLFSGIANREHAVRVTQTLTEDDSFSGWGIRTVAKGESRYNPMSYHNGSVWPHDNAMIAYGMARYGLNGSALQVLNAMFDVSQTVDLHRIPELFCGFERRGGEGPTLYPVACSPQAWSAGSVFMLLQACLGMSIDATKRTIHFRNPMLPRALEHLTLSGLQVRDASTDMLFQRNGEDVGITILRRTGQVEVVVVK